jgi:hypothetical protein
MRVYCKTGGMNRDTNKAVSHVRVVLIAFGAETMTSN